MSFPAKTLARLADHILAGDVVFFIGAGCSIDSEKNTASRLMRRILLRLVAFAESLDALGGDLIDDLQATFGLSGKAPQEIAYCTANIDALALRYYEANEWFSAAFVHLLEITVGLPDPERILKLVQVREEQLRKGLPNEMHDAVPFDEIAPLLLKCVRDNATGHEAAGKALFLDTMGFRHPGIMGGIPCADVDIRMIENSYHWRLLPRHHFLARFAREGLCSTLITTNFDLLLEGACLLAGFSNARELNFPTTLISSFDVVASPQEFFTKGKAHRTAVIVKMHGCAQRFRSIGYDRFHELLEYLRSMVFTYREIQNWREDSWAADYLRTLLRTRVVVFCGYSVQDPVIHDTFRSVYEEMRRLHGTTINLGIPESAPAFFFASDTVGTRQFHGMAILNAATEAVGGSRVQAGDHPNYVRFHRRSEKYFPNFDECMRWLFHLTFRARQQECLSSDLRRISTLLLESSRPEVELDTVRREFAGLRRRELDDAESWHEGNESRRRHREHCGWTDLFNVGLLREFACSDVMRQRQGGGLEIGLMRRFEWYYPAMQDASWTCWGAVVELALRAMACTMGCALSVANCPRPTVLVRYTDGTRHSPHALSIQVAWFERSGLDAKLHGCPLWRVYWELSPRDAPWPRVRRNPWTKIHAGPQRNCEGVMAMGTNSNEGRRTTLPAPEASLIWRWASRTASEDDARRAGTLLGLRTK